MLLSTQTGQFICQVKLNDNPALFYMAETTSSECAKCTLFACTF